MIASFFFFSSRRRHTRFDCDWSSDVCSSDLLGRLYQENAAKDSRALEKGLEVYRRLLDFEPGNVEARYQSAVLLGRLGSFQASLDHLSRLPAEDQQRAQALSVRCADYAGLGETARAEDAAARLLAREDLAEA